MRQLFLHISGKSDQISGFGYLMQIYGYTRYDVPERRSLREKTDCCHGVRLYDRADRLCVSRTGKSCFAVVEGGDVRDKIVVCSDIHLGIEDAYSETVGNRRYFVEFLERLATTTDVRELVIDGDFLDEWYLPLSYVETDRAEFYKAVIENNPHVFEAIGDVIASGIKVVYVVGNHDMSVDAGMIRALVPGLVVETDRPGVGVYITGDRNEIAIEHGHRYDVYSAPDTITNKAITKGQTLFPPGYFYARYAADWVISGKPSFVADIPVITDVPDKKTNEDQFFAYAYYRTLATEFSRITLGNKFGDKIFNIRIDGYDGTYSVQDMFPVLNDKGEISARCSFRIISGPGMPARMQME